MLNLKFFYSQCRTGFLLLLLLSIFLGIIYPCVITGIAQLLFPWQANGSLISHDQKLIGSKLIGQAFSDPRYFWGRPSATTPVPYNAALSAASNLGPTNPAFLQAVQTNINLYKKTDPKSGLIPVDLVTSSGSGLDPDISPLAALYQVSRVADARGLPQSQVTALVLNTIQPRWLGILGEPRVNILTLNLALDSLNLSNSSESPHGTRG